MKKNNSLFKDFSEWNFVIFLTLSLMLIVGVTTALRSDASSLFVRSKANSDTQQVVTPPSYCKTAEGVNFQTFEKECLAKNTNKETSDFTYAVRWEVRYENNGASCTASPACVTTIKGN
jgi:hypothetical protein